MLCQLNTRVADAHMSEVVQAPDEALPASLDCSTAGAWCSALQQGRLANASEHDLLGGFLMEQEREEGRKEKEREGKRERRKERKGGKREGREEGKKKKRKEGGKEG